MNSTHNQIKLFYFLIYASMGVFGPYLPLYFESINFSKSSIGFLLSLSTALTVWSNIFWGYISDKHQNRDKLLLICVIGNAITMLLFLFSSNYYYVLFSVFAAAFFFKPILPLTDCAALETVQIELETSYGKLRVWGTIGFLFANIFLSKIIENKGIKILFLLNAIIMLLSAVIPIMLTKNKILIKPEKTNFKDLKFFIKPIFIILFSATVLIEITNTVVFGFYAIFLSSIGFTTHQIGLAYAAGVIVEIPIMFYSGYLIKKAGLKIIIILGIAAHTIKFFVLSSVNSYDSILTVYTVQITHGIFFGAYYASLISLIDRMSPVKLKNTGQTIFAATTYSLGSIIGYIFNGALLEKSGFSKLFTVNACMLLTAMIIFLFTRFRFPKETL